MNLGQLRTALRDDSELLLGLPPSKAEPSRLLLPSDGDPLLLCIPDKLFGSILSQAGITYAGPSRFHRPRGIWLPDVPALCGWLRRQPSARLNQPVKLWDPFGRKGVCVKVKQSGLTVTSRVPSSVVRGIQACRSS